MSGQPDHDAPLTTAGGLPVDPVYRPAASRGYDDDLGDPGAFPFTRGVYGTMYRGRVWTMRQYAGFATAAES
ncbi:MAG: methylmalonyl-CoA mutase family protein, partial [Actinomycetota bacterium]|nr:methylmalonyl-CoA mutase family protein [Actinomycetota bacterium]